MLKITYSYSVTPKGMKILESIEDDNGNVATLKTFKRKEAAEKALESLYDCRNCIDCQDCLGCEGCTKCRNCQDSRECTNCTNSLNCHGCHDSAHLDGCLCCEKCAFCNDCQHCGNLIHGDSLNEVEVPKIADKKSLTINQINDPLLPYEITINDGGRVSSMKRANLGEALLYCLGFQESSKFQIIINPLATPLPKNFIVTVSN